MSSRGLILFISLPSRSVAQLRVKDNGVGQNIHCLTRCAPVSRMRIRAGDHRRGSAGTFSILTYGRGSEVLDQCCGCVGVASCPRKAKLEKTRHYICPDIPSIFVSKFLQVFGNQKLPVSPRRRYGFPPYPHFDFVPVHVASELENPATFQIENQTGK